MTEKPTLKAKVIIPVPRLYLQIDLPRGRGRSNSRRAHIVRTVKEVPGVENASMTGDTLLVVPTKNYLVVPSAKQLAQTVAKALGFEVKGRVEAIESHLITD